MYFAHKSAIGAGLNRDSSHSSTSCHSGGLRAGGAVIIWSLSGWCWLSARNISSSPNGSLQVVLLWGLVWASSHQGASFSSSRHLTSTPEREPRRDCTLFMESHWAPVLPSCSNVGTLRAAQVQEEGKGQFSRRTCGTGDKTVAISGQCNMPQVSLG